MWRKKRKWLLKPKNAKNSPLSSAFSHIFSVQNISIGDLITDWLSHWQYFYFWDTKSDPRDVWPLRHLIRVMRRHDLTKKYLHTYPLSYPHICTSTREHPKGAIICICDIWDTEHNTDNWEPGLMTIIVTWQLIVTLDSICNSCDVFMYHKSYSFWKSRDVSNSSYKSCCPPLLLWGYEKRMHTIWKAKGRLHCNQIGVCIHHAKGEIAHIVVCDGLGCICDVNQTPRHINPPDIPVMSRCRYLCPLLMDLSLFVSTVISI